MSLRVNLGGAAHAIMIINVPMGKEMPFMIASSKLN